VDEESYTIRFTPRRRGSNWSLKNINTAKKLIEKKLMHPAGLKTFENRKPEKSGVYSFERAEASFTSEFESAFRDNTEAWSFFTAQASSYQKTATYWVMSAKQEKTRLKRLNELIADSENQMKIKILRRANE
jgi:uncharacterized protein YdeI (YjbR/CyaY-like superfamily)